ncbi:MAG: BolA family transcriptional regulator [Acidobacteria bacterium]|nr:BolA family transcriptional regulator [Acidobacteriota bacterium]
MIDAAELEKRVRGAFPGATVTVTDLTGTRDHYRLAIVSDAFLGMGPVERHRAVYALFRDVLGGALHALSLETRTPEEQR